MLGHIITRAAHKSASRPCAPIGHSPGRRALSPVIGRSHADVTAGENILGRKLRTGTKAARAGGEDARQHHNRYNRWWCGEFATCCYWLRRHRKVRIILRQKGEKNPLFCESREQRRRCGLQTCCMLQCIGTFHGFHVQRVRILMASPLCTEDIKR